MDRETRKLFSKQKLTGLDFGKLYIKTRLSQHNLDDNRNEIGFSDKDLQDLALKVDDDAEITKANAYVNCYTWIDRYSVMVEAFYQQFYVSYSRLFFKVHKTIIAEQRLRELQEVTKDKDVEDSDYHSLKQFAENALFDLSLFAYWDDEVDNDFIKAGKEQMEMSLVEVYSYNKAVELIANYLKIPEILQLLKRDTTTIYGAIEGLNDKVIFLDSLISGSTSQETEKKKKFFNEMYPVFNLLDYEPTKEAVKKASASIGKCILQNNSYQILTTLRRKL